MAEQVYVPALIGLFYTGPTDCGVPSGGLTTFKAAMAYGQNFRSRMTGVFCKAVDGETPFFTAARRQQFTRVWHTCDSNPVLYL